LGLTFKAGTDDMRESPSIEVIERLIERGAHVTAYDPAVTTSPIAGVEVAKDAYAACDGAAVAVVLTEWDEFKWLDLDKLANTMAQRSIVDARNILDRGALNRRGFTYASIGRR
jgi:UDPglucose 6-dehydrogenase